MQKHLDNYLKTVSRGLELVPASERAKEIAELREHLEALTQAHLELGESEENAAVRATQQFGSALTVRRRLFFSYWQRHLTAFRQNWLGASVCTIVTAYLMFIVTPAILGFSHGNPNSNNNPSYLFWWSGYGWLLRCYFVGWLSFVLSGRRSLPVLVLLSVWFNLTNVVPVILDGLNSYEECRFIIIVASNTLVMPVLAAYISLRRSKSFRNA